MLGKCLQIVPSGLISYYKCLFLPSVLPLFCFTKHSDYSTWALPYYLDLWHRLLTMFVYAVQLLFWMPYLLDSLCILRIKWSLTLKFVERLLSFKEHLGVHWQKYWAWTGAIRGTCWSFMGPLGPCVVHRSPQILIGEQLAKQSQLF